MHNVRKKKTTAEQEASRKTKEAIQIKNYNHIVEQYRKWRDEGKRDTEALRLVTKVLSTNPESYTPWNYRREILLDMFKNMDNEQKEQLIQGELGFIMERLREYPKVYWIWNHRRWCLANQPNPDWQMELKLVSKMLEMDARNYHGWHYRRTVVAEMKDQDLTEQELAYTVAKINNNPANFSAWHNRSALLRKYVTDKSDGERKDVWLKELEYVRPGLYTDPDDQSCWLYHHWLVNQYQDLVPNATHAELVAMLNQEIQSVRELHEIEEDNKWCMMSLVDCYQSLTKLGEPHDGDVTTLLAKLTEIDPMRANRYKNFM